MNDQSYGEELDSIAAILEKLHPIGEVKGLGRMEAKLALMEVVDVVCDALDPEMSRRDIVNLRETFLKAKAVADTQPVL